MRRFKQELPHDECIELLVNSPRGVLAVLGDDDYPYTVPMNHVYIDGKIYFHAAKEGHKHDAIEKHSKVSYCVMNDGFRKYDNWWYTFKSVIVFGEMNIITNNDEKINILTQLGDKYFPNHEYTLNEIDKFSDKADVYELTVKHISGKLVREK